MRNCAPKLRSERLIVGVAELFVHDQCVPPPRLQHLTHFDLRRHASLDATWIEQHRKAALIGRPQLLVDFEERQFHYLTVVANELDVAPDASPRHGLRELQIQLQLVGREYRRRGYIFSRRVEAPTFVGSSNVMEASR